MENGETKPQGFSMNGMKRENFETKVKQKLQATINIPQLLYLYLYNILYYTYAYAFYVSYQVSSIMHTCIYLTQNSSTFHKIRIRTP